jgi:signal transduction histidine kinase
VEQRFNEIRSGVAMEAWETVRLARDGRRIPVSVTVAPLRDAAGVLIGESVITRDNTETKAAADRLEAANTALAARNAELRDFASIVSHDLRAPLRRLQLFAEMAVDAPGKDAEVSDLLERIRSSAGRMEALVIDLLSFARLGVSADGMRPVDLAEVAREAIEVQQSALTVSRAMVDVGDMPVVEGDPVLLRQVFANLIGNAVKFASQGVRPAVSISAGPSLPDELGREVVEITVSDNGIGFDPEYAERIFRIFERMSTEHAGTGVGLAICRKIVALHGGTVEATSASGEGATFSIRLPVEQPKEEPAHGE